MLLVGGVYRIGDAVMSLPALGQLAATAPPGGISVIAPGVSPEIYTRSGFPLRVVPVPNRGGLLRAFLRLKREARPHGGISRAVLLSGGFVWALGATLARVPVRTGLAADGRGFLLTEAVSPGRGRSHQIDEYCRVAGVPVSLSPELRLHEGDRDAAFEFLGEWDGSPFAAVCPGASHPSKRWPADRFITLCRKISGEYGFPCLLLGTAGDKGLLAGMCGEIPGARMAAGFPLGTVFALLKRARVFIGNNSGLAHAAAAVGTPGICISGPSDPFRTAPRGSEFRMLGGSPGGAAERGRGPHPGLLSVAADDVFETLGSLSVPV